MECSTIYHIIIFITYIFLYYKNSKNAFNFWNGLVEQKMDKLIVEIKIILMFGENLEDLYKMELFIHQLDKTESKPK